MPNFRYLNLANEWPLFQVDHLVQAADGAWQLDDSDPTVLSGSLLAGPFEITSDATHWQRVQVSATVPDGSHLQWFSLTAPDSAEPVSPASDPTIWHAAPRDAGDFLVQHAPARYLWLAATFTGDGAQSPTVEQIRVSFNEATWLQHLPAIYRRDDDSIKRSQRILSLLESALDDASNAIDTLAAHIDPAAAPDEGTHSWLEWLSGWLAFPLNETWSEAERRAALAEAFDLYGRRGTSATLRSLIKLYTGATAHISEPAHQLGLWTLGEDSVLGADTMLAAGSAEGAIVGTTATLDQSHIISQEAYGAPLFEDVAHHFCVQVYASDLQPGLDLEAVAQVIDDEKPAHTSYHLCEIDAQMRIGVQARLGIDSIVASGHSNFIPGQPHAIGTRVTLPEQAGVGGGMRIGGLVLGEAADSAEDDNSSRNGELNTED